MALAWYVRAGLSAVVMLLIAVVGVQGVTLPGAPSTVRASTNRPIQASDVYNTVQDVRKCVTVLSLAAAEYRGLRKTHDRIEFLLRGTCDNMQDKLKKWDRTRLLFAAVKKVPLGKLPKLAGVLSNGARTFKGKIEPPTDSICKVATKMRAATDKFDKTVGGKVLNKVTKVLDKTDKYLTKAEDIVKTWEAIKAGKTQVCPGFVNTYRELIEMKQSCERISEPFRKFTTELRDVTTTMTDKLERPVQNVRNILKTVDKGPLGVVSSVTNALARVKVKLPRAAVKERGAGVVPTCCPPGYMNTAGLCYKRCDSGWDTLAIVCMQRCRGGYATVGPSCVRKNILRPKVYLRRTQPRLGSAPAVHSKHACACRRDGRTHLGGGLCYRKCGTGRFTGYNTALLTTCMDTRLNQYTVEQLAKKLSIFDKIKKVPGIGDILSIADKVIDKALRPVEKLAAKAFDLIKIPSLDFSAIKLDLGALPPVVQNAINNIEKLASTVPIVDFNLNGLCIDISIEK